MVRVLVPSASYLLTDHLLSSEGVFCYNLFKQLERLGYSFEAISAQVKIKNPLKNTTFHEVASHTLTPGSNLLEKYYIHTKFLIGSFIKSKQILKTKDIDIIHHMLPAIHNQTFSLLAIFKESKHPFIMGPISAHIYQRPTDERALNILTSKLHYKTIQRCEGIITITDQVKNIYKKFIDQDKIWVIPMGVDTEIFKPNKNKIHKEHKEILFAGYLYKLKGCEYLIRALHNILKKRKDVKLRIIGDGPERIKLENLTKKLKIKEYVNFEGFKPYNEMPKYYNQCDIFCFPTLGEPFGKAIIEAMACGKSVIASNVGGPSEIIKDGETGILVPPSKPDILKIKILELLDDETLLNKIGTNARKEVEKRFSFEKIVEKYDKFYKEIL